MNLKIRSEVDSIELTAIARRTADWKTATWSVGIKGKMKGMFSRVMVRTVENTTKRYVTDEVCWLLLEMIVDRSGSEELKTHLSWGMEAASLKQFVRCALITWAVEQFHRDVKQLLGLDRSEGRSCKGWYHYISMAPLAFAFISSLRAGMQSKNDRLPSLPAMARTVVLEVATQDLMKSNGLLRTKAKRIAETMLRGYSDW